MYTLFLILIVLAAVLMIAIVLIQESKGGGLASNFSSSNSIMGVRKTTDFVEKATWGLAISLVVFSVVCAYTAPQADGSQSVMENATEAPQTILTTCKASVQPRRQLRHRAPRRQLRQLSRVLQQQLQ